MSKSSTTPAELLHNPTPGEILQQDFLIPLSLSQTGLAQREWRTGARSTTS